MGFLQQLNPLRVTPSSSGCDGFSMNANSCDAGIRMLVIKLLFFISLLYTIVIFVIFIVNVTEKDLNDILFKKYAISLGVMQLIMLIIYMFLAKFNWLSQYGNKNALLSKLNSYSRINCGSIIERCTSAPAGLMSFALFIAYGGILISFGKEYNDVMNKEWQQSFGKSSITLGSIYIFFGLWILLMSLLYPVGNVLGGILPVIQSSTSSLSS